MKHEGVKNKGQVHIYTGNGKGKTTAALGLALRALGQGKKVCFLQFLKNGSDSGERKISIYLPNFTFICFGAKDFVYCRRVRQEDIIFAEQALGKAKEILRSGRYDLVVLDEVFNAVNLKLIKIKQIIALLRTRAKAMEVVLTGRKAPQEIIKIADLVSEIRQKKHYYQKGLKARKGIEY